MKFLLLLLCGAPWAAPTEVIQNGGFEDGTLGWTNQGCQSTAVEWDVYSGSKSLQVHQRTETWAGPVQTLDLDLVKNQPGGKLRYALKLHAGDTFQYSWTLKLKKNDGDKYIHLVDEILNSGDGWKEMEVSVDFPQFYDVNSAQLFLEGSPVDVEPLVDSVSLVVGEDTTSGGSWEDEANARIDLVRKRNLTISVQTKEHVDPSNFKIELNHISHKFPFGTALNGQKIRSCMENGLDDLYCTFAKENFNYVVLENAMKWASIEPNRGQFRYENADSTLLWASERGMRARGHTMFWAVPHHQTPAWVEALAGKDMVDAVQEHVENVVKHFDGMVEAWDVNNEMIHGSFFVDQSGDDSIRVKMFEWAHQKSPELLLFVNDYNIIAGNEEAKYRQLIQNLLDQGAPISGIGVQGHFGGNPINLDKVSDIIKDLAQFNLPIWVTEFDWAGSNPDHVEHARQLENFYRLMFSLEEVHGVLMWGFWDQAHWKPEAAIVNGDDLKPNAAGEAYMKLIHSEWNSGDILAHNGDLTFFKRVHQGHYKIRVIDGEQVLGEQELDVDTDSDIVIHL